MLVAKYTKISDFAGQFYPVCSYVQTQRFKLIQLFVKLIDLYKTYTTMRKNYETKQN